MKSFTLRSPMNADVDSYSPSFLDSLPERGGPNEPNRSRALLPERSPGEVFLEEEDAEHFARELAHVWAESHGALP